MREQIWAVAYSTYRSIFRYKVLWLVPIVGVYFVIMGIVLYYTGDKSDVAEMLHRMVGSITNTFRELGQFFALVVGATLISRELEQKTLHPMILKPMPLGAFFAGKFLGAVLFYAVCYGALAFFLFAASWGVEGKPNFTLFAVFALMVLGLSGVAAVTMALAQGVRQPVAAGGVVFIGALLAAEGEHIRDRLIAGSDKVPEWLMNGLAVFLEIIRFIALPGEEFWVMDDHVSRGALLWERLAWVIPYGLVYCAAAVAVGSFYFTRYNRYRA